VFPRQTRLALFMVFHRKATSSAQHAAGPILNWVEKMERPCGSCGGWSRFGLDCPWKRRETMLVTKLKAVTAVILEAL
jgi:hypothetical protein